MSQAINKWLNKIGLTSHEILMEDIINFKRNISCIDNLIAVEQAIVFLERLKANKKIDDSEYKEIIEQMDAPNARGYDVFYNKNNRKIVAELKGTIPCEKKQTTFGANQRDAIIKDLRGLLKTKNEKKYGQLDGYDKYMVLFDFAKAAMEDLLGKDKLTVTEKEEIKEQITFIYISEKERQTLVNRNIEFKF